MLFPCGQWKRLHIRHSEEVYKNYENQLQQLQYIYSSLRTEGKYVCVCVCVCVRACVHACVYVRPHDNRNI